MNRTWLDGFFRQRRLWWVAAGALAAVGLAVSLFWHTVRNMDVAMKDWLPAVDALCPADSGILARVSPSRWQVLSSQRSRVRNPVNYLRLDHQYRLVMYRIDVCADTGWNQFMHIALEPARRTPGSAYRVLDPAGNFQVEYRAGRPPLACRLVVNLSTDTLRSVLKSDSLLCFYFKADALTIRYAENAPVDVSIESTVTGGTLGTFTQEIPMTLAFLKRPGAVYFFILTSETPEGAVPPGVLAAALAPGR